jgi:hypothetical protein
MSEPNATTPNSAPARHPPVRGQQRFHLCVCVVHNEERFRSSQRNTHTGRVAQPIVPCNLRRLRGALATTSRLSLLLLLLLNGAEGQLWPAGANTNKSREPVVIPCAITLSTVTGPTAGTFPASRSASCCSSKARLASRSLGVKGLDCFFDDIEPLLPAQQLNPMSGQICVIRGVFALSGVFPVHSVWEHQKMRLTRVPPVSGSAWCSCFPGSGDEGSVERSAVG